MNVKLTAKQDMFCREYLKDLNATQAAIRAGYKPDNAYATGAENLKKPQIAQYIANLKAKRAEEVRIDAAWVLRQAVKVHERCMQAEKVTMSNGEPMLDDDGNPIYKFEHAGANKSLEIIGKHVDVKAFEIEQAKTDSDSLAESVSKLIDKLPS